MARAKVVTRGEVQRTPVGVVPLGLGASVEVVVVHRLWLTSDEDEREGCRSARTAAPGAVEVRRHEPHGRVFDELGGMTVASARRLSALLDEAAAVAERGTPNSADRGSST